MQIVGGNQLSWSDAAARRFCATNALLQSLLFIFNIYAGIVTPGSRLTPNRDDDKYYSRAVEMMSAERNGPAYRAGVRTGDFILALNGQAVGWGE